MKYILQKMRERERITVGTSKEIVGLTWRKVVFVRVIVEEKSFLYIDL